MNAIQYLNSFINFETQLDQVDNKAFKLDRIYHLLQAFDSPDKKYPIVHIAGSKGKGSSCAILASILNAAGLKVGLYTSPHLQKVNERMQIIGEGPITDDKFDALVAKYHEKIEEIRLKEDLGRMTFYEVTTALAAVFFAEEKVDVAIFETGLGGRLDATNMLDSQFSAITSISLEHTQILGDTIEDIAQEKAGIIKSEHQGVVLANQEPEALDVLLHRCQQFGVSPLVVDHDLTYRIKEANWQGNTFDVILEQDILQDLHLTLLGEHQVANATLAIGLVEKMKEKGFVITESAIAQGLEEVNWPGRCEVIEQAPVTVLDCAHNEDSLKRLAQTLFLLNQAKKDVTVVLGVSSDKDIAKMCEVIDHIATRVILTQAKHPRAYKWTNEKIYFQGKDIAIIPDVTQAVTEAQAHSEALVVVTGSVFVVAEARAGLGIKA